MKTILLKDIYIIADSLCPCGHIKSETNNLFDYKADCIDDNWRDIISGQVVFNSSITCMLIKKLIAALYTEVAALNRRR